MIHRLDFGGLENGVVNIINRTPPERYRHAVVCLTGYTDFRKRITRADVPVLALGKRAGKDLAVYGRIWRLFRRLRPAIVHTRNLPAVDMVVPAALAGVPCRIHSEHGRDVAELHGGAGRYERYRRWLRPLVDHYIAMSRDLEAWLEASIGVPAGRVTQIYNGVDSGRFHPAPGGRDSMPGAPDFTPGGTIVIGTVGRMETVKDQPTLARAFVALAGMVPAGTRRRLRLALVGDGGLRAPAERVLAEGGCADLAWLPGARDDTPEIYRALDIFVLPSLTEGISNTILEAMASGLPVVATRVGGNPELVVEGETGVLVPAADVDAMAGALLAYVGDPGRARAHGLAGRARIEASFSLDGMVARYLSTYDAALAAKGIPIPVRAS